MIVDDVAFVRNTLREIFTEAGYLIAGEAAGLNALLQSFKRQALHAQRLTLAHPRSGDERVFEAPLPADFETLLAALRRDASEPRGRRRAR